MAGKVTLSEIPPVTEITEPAPFPVIAETAGEPPTVTAALLFPDESTHVLRDESVV